MVFGNHANQTKIGFCNILVTVGWITAFWRKKYEAEDKIFTDDRTSRAKKFGIGILLLKTSRHLVIAILPDQLIGNLGNRTNECLCSFLLAIVQCPSKVSADGLNRWRQISNLKICNNAT